MFLYNNNDTNTQDNMVL